MWKFVVAAIMATLTTGAMADLGAFAGVSYAFGAKSGVGFTLQATSSRREDRAIVAGGLSYYPFAAQPHFGTPIGVGYQGEDFAGIVSYDFMLRNISVSAGYTPTVPD